MINDDGYYIQKCKLFPLTNPNFNMLNTPEELIKLLPYVLIVTSQHGLQVSDKIIGTVQNGEFTIEDGFIWGDVLFHISEYKTYKWVNAGCVVDMIDDNNTDGYVTRIVEIEYKRE